VRLLLDCSYPVDNALDVATNLVKTILQELPALSITIDKDPIGPRWLKYVVPLSNGFPYRREECIDLLRRRSDEVVLAGGYELDKVFELLFPAL